MNKKKVIVEGITFEDQTKACKKIKIKYGTFRTRLRLGLSIKDALTKRNKNENSVIVNGIKYKNRFTASRKLKISRATVTSRIRAGKSVEDALTDPIIPRGAHIKLNIDEKFLKRLIREKKLIFLVL